jgi:outer membrane protein assembly factor BamB
MDQSESLSALSLETGERVWNVTVPGRHFEALGGLGPRSTPTIVRQGNEEIVVAQTALGIVLCVELRDGSIRWKKDLLELAGMSQLQSEAWIKWGRSASPLVIGDKVILPLGGNSADKLQAKSLIALSLDDGKEIWRAGTAQIAYGSPNRVTIDGVEQIVSVNEGIVTGHDVADGNVLWSSEWVSHSNSDACASQPVSAGGNRFLIGKGYAQGSKLIEVHRTQSDWVASDLWTDTRLMKTKFTSAIYYDGLLYALSDGVLECVDPNSGKRVWRGSRFGQGQALMVNGTILVTAEDGRIAAANPKNGQTIAQLPVLEGITWNYPCVAGPYLLVRNGEQAACLRSVSAKGDSQP